MDPRAVTHAFTEHAGREQLPETDELIGPRVRKLWFESFRVAGGRGELVVVPPFPERRGHGLFPAPAGIPIWTAAVAKFFSSQGLALPF
jgi:hypothetical protein